MWYRKSRTKNWFASKFYFQKLPGDVNWLRPHLKLTTGGLKPLLDVIKGDAKSASIAAASILAKVERDNLLIKLDREFPMYGWKNNKGYLSSGTY